MSSADDAEPTPNPSSPAPAPQRRARGDDTADETKEPPVFDASPESADVAVGSDPEFEAGSLESDDEPEGDLGRVSGRRIAWAKGGDVIALAIALIAVALAAWSLLRPPPASTAAPVTDQQIAAAKVRACTAYATVRSAVSLQTHANTGTDPVAVQATAANARLSLAAGGFYLLGRVDAATPPPLATAIRSFAENLQDIAMNTLAGAGNTDPAQAARLSSGETTSAKITDLCK